MSNSVISTMSGLLASGKYSDFTISCKGRIFKVHRAVVCSQSKPIAAAIDGSFKEAVLGEIDMEDEDPDIVSKMLDFLYTADYDDSRSAGLLSSIAYLLIGNAKVYVIADKYDIQPLKLLAAAKYTTNLTLFPVTSGFVPSIRLLLIQYPVADQGLKDVIIKAAAKHIEKLMKRADFETLCREDGDFACEVLMASLPTTSNVNEVP